MTTPTALEAFARAKGGTVFHPAGTCRMGGDARSVVDARLRVRGVERLRVIDASVMPRVVSTNTNAAAIMIGEKGAALVREDAAGRASGARAGEAARGVILDSAQAPLYVQLADLFRQRIVKGVWKEGEKLPSLEQLVAEFAVARVTVRQAVERLTRDGLVSPQRGRGTFVTGAPSNDRWLRVETSLRSLADVYRDTHPTILNIDESTRSPRLDRRATASRRRSTSTCAASTRTRGGRTASSTSTSTPRSSRVTRRGFARRR